MSGAVVTLLGIRVRVVPEASAEQADCQGCVFRGGDCPSADEERAVGTVPCYTDEGHYYAREEEDAQA